MLELVWCVGGREGGCFNLQEMGQKAPICAHTHGLLCSGMEFEKGVIAMSATGMTPESVENLGRLAGWRKGLAN